MINDLDDPVKFWDTSNHEILEAARGCVGGRPRSRGGFASAETLDSIKKSRAARLTGTSKGLCHVELELF